MTIQHHDRPDFSGKVVTFYAAHTPASCAVSIVSPKFTVQAGRLFISGKVAPQDPPNWDDGLENAIAWDQVSSYVVFDSIEEYQTRLDSYHSSEAPE